MKILVSSARFSLIARERPARLLKLLGVATTPPSGARRSAKWFFVEVLPYEPVIATTRGCIRASRAAAWVTKVWARRDSYGRSSRVVTARIGGTAHTTATASSHGRGEKSPAPAITIEITVASTATVMRRRVHRSRLVRP